VAVFHLEECPACWTWLVRDGRGWQFWMRSQMFGVNYTQNLQGVPTSDVSGRWPGIYLVTMGRLLLRDFYCAISTL
jgi:hypothetical protein